MGASDRYLEAARLLIDTGLEVCAHHTPPLSPRVDQVLRQLESGLIIARWKAERAWASAKEPRPDTADVDRPLARYAAAAAAGHLGQSLL